ncbi:MAG: putative toxin-antitoxin system toxin component, PIN family [candidate division NC10 bacterium RBG_16_65_8]|nr:MAG: putative toxin-antitoxin system toxin component, PIN family [candidate division NC10 bacterium RBG_16_65_8]
MRIVLDTNVLVAGLLNPVGACGRLLDLVLDGAVVCSADERILQEYEEVLRRARLALPAGPVREVLAFLRQSADLVAPLPLDRKLPDPDDLPFLEVAAAAGAILVTGNLRHFPKKALGRVTVVSAAESLDLLRRSA